MFKYISYCFYLSFILLVSSCGSDVDKAPLDKPNPIEQEAPKLEKTKPLAKKMEGSITVYTDQKEAIELEIFQEFEEYSGLKLNLVHKTSPLLIYQLKKEGKNSPADLLLLDGLNNLNTAKSEGVFQKLISSRAESQIPEEYRDEDRHWYGLTRDATIIVYAKESLDPSKMSYYEYFSRGEWKGKLLVPNANHNHIQSLVASILAWDDMGKANEFLTGIVGNLAAPAFETEAEMLNALVKGEGEMALVSSSSYAKFVHENTAAVKDKFAVFYPKNMGGATHFDVSGIGICRHAPHPELAGKFIEFLGEKEVQARYGAAKFCYPANTMTSANEILKSWGKYRGDDLPFSKLYQYEKQAAVLLKTVKWK